MAKKLGYRKIFLAENERSIMEGQFQISRGRVLQMVVSCSYYYKLLCTVEGCIWEWVMLCIDEHMQSGVIMLHEWCGCMHWERCAWLGLHFSTPVAWWLFKVVISLWLVKTYIFWILMYHVFCQTWMLLFVQGKIKWDDKVVKFKVWSVSEIW